MEESIKFINGLRYIHKPVCRLSCLNINCEYIFVSCKPTKFNSYIATVRDENNKEFNVYVPEYIVFFALPGKRFVYNGVQPNTCGNGYSYHQVLWAEE